MQPEKLKEMIGIEDGDYETTEASQFVAIICEKLSKFGKTQKEVLVDDRGDGKRGRIDIVFHFRDSLIPIEIDRKSVRAKSRFKVLRFNPEEAFCITRSPFSVQRA